MRLILASASPRRAELLRSAGFDFAVDPSNVEEMPREGESAEDYTLRVARDKARDVAARTSVPDAAVLGADTEVVVDGRILGKPEDEEHAVEMLKLLSGRAHEVITAVVVCRGSQEAFDAIKTRVHFSALTHEEIREYVSTGEPMGKAGAYAIQGYAARFIDRIDGSWSNVVGLPIHAVHQLLSRARAGVTDPA